jgi:K+-sensing histidine kinase KdpD
VSVAVEPAGEGYAGQLVVSDQGPGIPEGERHQVYTRFYRGTGEAVVQTRGVGIGLSVVAELVARLRGDVIVGEAPGGGAQFIVRFPASSPSLLAKETEHAPTT